MSTFTDLSRDNINSVNNDQKVLKYAECGNLHGPVTHNHSLVHAPAKKS